MNTESILSQFDVIEKSMQRAKLPFETDMLAKEVIEVTLYELIKSYKQIENLVREIDPERFGPKKSVSIRIPSLEVHNLNLCEFCGSAECQSDHK